MGASTVLALIALAVGVTWFSFELSSAREKARLQNVSLKSEEARTATQEFYARYGRIRERGLTRRSGWLAKNLEEIKETAPFLDTVDARQLLRTEALRCFCSHDVLTGTILLPGIDARYMAHHPTLPILALGDNCTIDDASVAIHLLDTRTDANRRLVKVAVKDGLPEGDYQLRIRHPDTNNLANTYRVGSSDRMLRDDLHVNFCISRMQPVGPEIRGNQTTNGFQGHYYSRRQSVAADQLGNFVVVWTSDHGGTADVWGRRFKSTGVPLGDEFQINTFTIDAQASPVIAMSPKGDFVIAWQSNLQDGDNYGVFAQRYVADGTRRGGEFQVNQTTRFVQSEQSIAIDSQGCIVIAWQSYVDDGYTNYQGEIYARRYDASGQPLGGEFHVNANLNGRQHSPQVAMDGSGNAVIVWGSLNKNGNGFDVCCRRFDVTNQPLSPEIGVITSMPIDANSVSVAMDSVGHFVVSWTTGNVDPPRSQGVFFQVFNSQMIPIGTVQSVGNPTNCRQDYTSVAMDEKGEFVITWTGFGQDPDGSEGVYAQRYSAGGIALANPFRLNTFTDGGQRYSSACMIAGGDLLATWTSDEQDPDRSSGVYLQRFKNPSTSTHLSTNLDGKTASLPLDLKLQPPAADSEFIDPERRTKKSVSHNPRDSLRATDWNLVRDGIDVSNQIAGIAWNLDPARDLPSLAFSVPTQVGNSGLDGCRSVTFTPNGDKLLVGSRRGWIYVWDTENWRQIDSWQAHSDWVIGLVVDARGDKVYTASSSGDVKQWQLTNHVLENETKVPGEVFGLCRTDNHLVVSANTGSTINLSNFRSQTFGDIWKEPAAATRSTGIDNVYIAYGRNLVQAKLDPSRPIREFDDPRFRWAHQDSIQTVRASPSGRFAASSDGSTIKVWDSVAGTLISSINVEDSGGNTLEFLPEDNKLIVSGTGNVRQYQIFQHAGWTSFPGDSEALVHGSRSHSGEYLAQLSLKTGAENEEGTLQIRNLKSGVVHERSAEVADNDELLFSYDDKLLFVTNGRRSCLSVYETTNFTIVRTISRPPHLHCVTAHPTSERVFFSADNVNDRNYRKHPSALFACNSANGKTELLWSNAEAQERIGRSQILAITVGRSLLATSSRGGQIHIHDATTGSVVATIPVSSDVTRLQFIGDSLLLAGDELGNISIRNLPEGNVLAQVSEHHEAISGLVADDHGRLIVSACRGGELRFWTLKSESNKLELMAELGPLSGLIKGLQMSRDGNTISLLVDGESSIRILSLESIREGFKDLGLTSFGE